VRREDEPREGQSTLVEFRLEAVAEGTLVRQSESGFDSLPGEAAKHVRRADQAWGIILGMLEKHFAAR